MRIIIQVIALFAFVWASTNDAHTQQYVQNKRIENPGEPFWAVTSNIGESVDIDGDYAVAGARNSDSANVKIGAALVYFRDQGGSDNWGPVKRLFVNGLGENANFGSDVAIQGDIIAVGAPIYNESSGAVFLFQKDEGGSNNWGLFKTIEVSSMASQPNFGKAIGFHDSTLVVLGDSRVFIFYQNEGGPNNWGLVTTTEPTNLEGFYITNDVDVHSGNLVMGIRDEDTNFQDAGSVVVFQKDQGGIDNWGQVKKITPSNASIFDYFGSSVCMYEDRLAVGADNADGTVVGSGLAYIFEKDHGGVDNWGEVTYVEASDAGSSDDFGIGIAVNEDFMIVGAYFNDDNGTSSGSAYVFGRNEGGSNNWGEIKKILPSDNKSGDWFGAAVAMDGTDLCIGAEQDNDQGTGAGSIYLFEQDEGGPSNWGQTAESRCTDGARQDFFAEVVVHDGDMLAIACNYDDVEYYRSGSVLLYGRNQGGSGNWGLMKKLSASNPLYRLAFATSIDLEDTLLVAGTPFLQNTVGRAYIFSKNAGGINNWGQTHIITASDSVAAGGFAFDIEISGDIIASATYIPGGGSSVYVYQRDAGGMNEWGEVKKIVPSTVPLGGSDETTLALENNLLVVGSSGTQKVYLYGRNEGGSNNWGEVKVINAPMSDTPNAFGCEVDLHGDLLAVSAKEDSEVSNNVGAVYVYGRNTGGIDNWGLIKKVTQSGLDDGAEFGYSVSITDSILAVGAPRQNSNLGYVYVYKINEGGVNNWGFSQQLTGNETTTPDRFGYAVDLWQHELLAGAPRDVDDRGADSAGSAFIFDRGDNPCPGILTISDQTFNSNALLNAGQEINLSNVTISNTASVILTAPEISINGSFNMANGTELLTVSEDGCN